MTWSYTPVVTDKDQVRLLIGDTEVTDQLLEDEEIDFFLANCPSVNTAASKSARSIASKFSRLADQKTGDISVSFSQQAEAYLKIAEELESQAAISQGVPFSGGISKSVDEVNDLDPDRKRPAFEVGMDDNFTRNIFNSDIEDSIV